MILEFDGVTVALLPWPNAARRAAMLAAARQPRLLLVAAGSPPPTLRDEFEDWVRIPVGERDIEVRARRLARIALEHSDDLAAISQPDSAEEDSDG